MTAKVVFRTPQIELYNGDALDVLRSLPTESFDCVITSPPYYGLRDYGVEGQIGNEPSLAEYIGALVNVFSEVWRTLKPSGTVWLNLGDSYAGTNRSDKNKGWIRRAKRYSGGGKTDRAVVQPTATPLSGFKPKNLMMVPHRVAIALQDWGWYVRNDNVWAKPNPMPESVRDRCSRSHEYVFQLAKSEQYFFNSEAIREPATVGWCGSKFTTGKTKAAREHLSSVGTGDRGSYSQTRTKRTVWNIATKPYPDAHFAVFPRDIPELCIKAGCPVDGVVLDPFAGSGTTLEIAKELGRKAIGIELNPEYCKLIEHRCRQLTVFGVKAL